MYETFDFNSWLASGTVNEEQVTIVLDQHAAAECERLAEQIETALEAEQRAGGDAPMSHSEASQLEEEWQAAYARFQRGLATFTMRASSKDDEDATFEAVPVAKMPPRPLPQAGNDAFKKWQEALAEYQEETQRLDDLRQEWLTARCVVRIETGDGNVTHEATPEQISALRRTPGGQKHYDALTGAVNRATEGRVEAPRPKSLEPSTSDQG